MVRKYMFLLFLLAVALDATADTWSDPKITVIYSQNKEYMLKVYPRTYQKNYHRKLNKKELIKDTVRVCYAVLYRISNSDTVEIWNKPLVNLVSPVDIIVANDGKSVVTFDDWGMKGFKHTMVVYGERGEMIKDFDLEDISPFPIEQYSRSISSIFWGGRGEYLDNNRISIYFKNKNHEIKKRIFNIKKEAFDS